MMKDVVRTVTLCFFFTLRIHGLGQKTRYSYSLLRGRSGDPDFSHPSRPTLCIMGNIYFSGYGSRSAVFNPSLSTTEVKGTVEL